MSDKKYYCIYIATPLNEAPLLRAFREKRVDLEFWYPKYSGSKFLKKKVRAVMRPVFSTYAFINCAYSQELSDLVSNVNGCYFVLGASKVPTSINDSEMEDFKTRIKEYVTSGTVGGKILPPDSQVDIISGALAGYQATVKAAVKGTVIAEITMFGRTIPITLKPSEISAL